MNLPSQARIVVIGGGAVGCSIAYHLGKLGQKDVLVLEKSGLTHGSTWHAAGLVGQLRSKRNLTRLMQYSAQLYGRLEAETGQATGPWSVSTRLMRRPSVSKPVTSTFSTMRTPLERAPLA